MTEGYQNPMRGMERRLAPDFAQREMRDPGLKSSGLGSLHHTMPHLRRISAGAMRLAEGGAASPAAAPPDPQDLMEPEDQQSPDEGDERQVVLEAMAALEGQSEDPEEALAHFIDTFGPQALKDLQQMVESKHRQGEQQGDEEDDEDEGEDEGAETGGDNDEQEDELAGASGGLLYGPGTGQSDEIEGATPSGRPVLLSDGEYVFDAPTVAALGDGSTNAGARRLDDLRKQIRRDAYGHDKQAKPMRKGGIKL